jgi:SEC-C motif-containing protein
MIDRPPTSACPCSSGRTYKRCCLPFHAGKPAPTPEALMRSRYSAYAIAAIDYLIETTDPSGPYHRDDRAVWAGEIEQFCATTRFERLTIEFTSIADDGLGGEVRFLAKLSRAGVDVSFTEHSRFSKLADRWLYHSGVTNDESAD